MKELHPAAIVKQESSARLAEQAAMGILKNIAAGERKLLRDRSELGAQLAAIRKARKGDDFVATLKRLGLTTSVAYEDISIFENWSLVSGCRKKSEALKLIKDNLLSRKPEDIENDESSSAYASDGGNESEEIDVSGESESSEEAAAAPSGSGDAAEDATDGALLDAEGLVLPESVRPVLEGAKTITEWLKKANGLAKELRDLTATPAGVHIPFEVVVKTMRAGWRMVSCHKPDPIYRCNLCNGAGCGKCKKSGWLPKPMLEEHVGKPTQDRRPI